MVETRKQVRRVVRAATLALAIGMTASALAGPAAWSGGWSTSGFERLTSWWTSFWGGAPQTVQGASEAAPNLDPDGTSPQLGEPGDALSLDDGEPHDDPAAYPNLDPNG